MTAVAPPRALLAVAAVVGAAAPAARVLRGEVPALVVLVAVAAGLVAVATSGGRTVRPVPALLAVAALGGLVATVGVGPAVVVGGGTSLAVVALGGAGRPMVPVVLVPVAAAELVYALDGPKALVVGGLAVGAALAVGGIGRQVGAALATVLVALVALPLLYLPSGLARLVRAVLGPPDGTVGTWVPAPSVEADRRRARLPFAAPRGVGFARHVVGAAVLAVAVAGVAVAGLAPDGEPSVAPDPAEADDPTPGRDIFALEFETPYSALPAYEGVAWADQLQRDEAAPGGAPGERLANVVDGVRVTIPPSCPCPEVTLWFVGGSAAWGQGQRDEHTIASELVRLAGDDGVALRVVNLAQRGAVVHQEVEAVRARLEGGAAPPDVVVFYDGWNDVLMDVGALFTGSEAPGPGSTLSMEDVLAINGRPDEFLAGTFGPEAGRRAAARYRAAQAEAARLLAPTGADVRHYLQPDAFSSARQMQGYEDLSGIAPEAFLRSPFAEALDAASAALAGDVTDLRHMFDSHPDPVFVGLIHQNEAGARLVAERMWETLGPTVTARAR